jgi:hypothetical protein
MTTGVDGAGGGATGSIGPRIVAPAALGFGHYQIRPEQTEQAVSAALAAGYRHLDTPRPTATRKPWRGASQQRRPPGHQDNLDLFRVPPSRFQDPMSNTPHAPLEVARVGLTARAVCTPSGGCDDEHPQAHCGGRV